MANIITFLRIPLAIALLFIPPFSVTFWVIYFMCGVTDMLDGFVARTLHKESAFGAKLDSISDIFFTVCITIFVIINIEISIWLWICILIITLIRLLSYGIGYYKYHAFTSLHTYANKITGVLIFMGMVFYRMFGLELTGIILCTVAFLSSAEELAITIKSKELDNDCKSIFMH